MANVVMRGRDAVSAKLAECFITVSGNRYNFMQAIDFEAKFKRTKTDVPVLGRTGYANKAVSWKGSGVATFHYNSSVFREIMLKFKETGEDAYFTIQVSNDDPASAAGRQTVIFEGCNIDGGILAKFDANGEYLDEKIEFTFDDFRIAEKFAPLSGM